MAGIVRLSPLPPGEGWVRVAAIHAPEGARHDALTLASPEGEGFAHCGAMQPRFTCISPAFCRDAGVVMGFGRPGDGRGIPGRPPAFRLHFTLTT
jgi:hypothetical protein